MRRLRSLGRRVRWQMRDALAVRSTVRTRGVSFTLACDNWITQFRHDSFETKEPETLDWIDTQVRDGDVLFDVGGNIGVFSIYAALRHPRARVFVFEPEYSNLHLLRDNVVANRLDSRVRMFPIALSDRTGVSQLHVQDLMPGAALHTEAAAAMPTTESGERVVASEGTWAMTLDEFCAQAATWPNALKLDVDGGENRVLAGARTVLSRAEFRTLIAEVDGGGLHSDIVAMLGGAGLRRAKNARPSEAGNQVWQR